MKKSFSEQELDESEQYAHVTEQLKEVETQLDETLDEFGIEDFHTAFRRLD